jgi:hypothetical protein
MTRPRLSRAARCELAKRRRADHEARTMAFIESRLAAITLVTQQALMLKIAKAKGRLPDARFEAAIERLEARLDALGWEAPAPYDPPAMKS